MKLSAKMFLKFILLYKTSVNILKINNKHHAALIFSSFTSIKNPVKWRNLWQITSIDIMSVKKLLSDHLNNYIMILITPQVFYNVINFFKHIMSLNFTMCFHDESHLLTDSLSCATVVIYKKFFNQNIFIIIMSVISLNISIKTLRIYTSIITTFFMWKIKFINHF